ncbi:unnamed protein product [Didymodactylos carnosus]|uniref:Uncharacterized protein n=1 Tax=Didymodactylos carnosus TaxID=1234261 RepID=A0A814WFU4_9BILA|nr:unnamed protein product [Didymodactylos carnosus]CAF1230028.1 unnamed protein product [Didymodactylos carnosus]CAF3965250.1 unnamed protein product [Didymodactylos carnosus]CAF4038091.1 unnamed protein product [Didymodactylos carnosus]
MLCMIIFLLLILFITFKLYQHFFPAPLVNPQGKYVLISGCDTGFGHELAKVLDGQGFNVLAGVYSNESKEKLGKNLSKKATVFKLDITKQQDIDAAFDLVKAKTDNLYALVNNAGVGKGGLIDWIPMQLYRDLMEVNFFGHVSMTKTFLPLLLKQAGNRVINLTSVAGYFAGPALSPYCASKSALEAFSDCLRREMATWGLKVSILEPGFMRTAIIEGHKETLKRLWADLPVATQERWGEGFFNNQLQNRTNNVFMKHAQDPIIVVRALQHAVSSTQPRIRYRPGWQSAYFFYPLSMMPACVGDFVLSLTGTKGEKPAGVLKRLEQAVKQSQPN